MITNRIKDMGSTARELILSVVLAGALFQGAGMWFVKEKWYFTAGLWIGVLISVMMAVHMEYSIQNAVELPEEDAPGYFRKMYALRTGIVLVLFGCTVLLDLGNVVSLFLGLFALKIGAYLQPILHRLLVKIRKKGR